MSNPGVITLSEKKLSPTKQFRVEDNLGESVHFHYNDIRIDLTLDELLYIAEVNEDAIYDLVKAKNFNLVDFDDEFLNDISKYLVDLMDVRHECISVNKTYYLTKNLCRLPVRRRISSSRAKKLWTGKDIDTTEKPVVFNEDSTIMFGKEQVANALNAGEDNIEVIRMIFDKQKHTPSKHPWVGFLFHWDKKRIFNLAKNMAMKLIK